MTITSKEVTLAIGIITGVASLIFLAGNLFFNKSYSYLGIALCVLSCTMLLSLYFKGKKEETS